MTSKFDGWKNIKPKLKAVAEAPCPDCGYMVQVFKNKGRFTLWNRIRRQMVAHLKTHGYTGRAVSVKADGLCVRYPDGSQPNARTSF